LPTNDSEQVLALLTNRRAARRCGDFGEAAPFARRSVLAGTARQATDGPRSSIEPPRRTGANLLRI